MKKRKIRMEFAIKKKLNDEAISLINEFGLETEVDISGTPLLMACLYNNKEIANYCIDNGAEVNVKDADGYTPLILASEKGDFELVKKLIGKGADVNAKNKYEVTPLMSAISDQPDQLELIEILLKKGADPFIIIERDKDHPGRIANNAFELAQYFKRSNIIELIEKYFPNLGKNKV